MPNNSLVKSYSTFGFGCVSLATCKDLKKALSVLETALDCGVTYFDTAPIYSAGYSEKIIGYFQKNKRDKIQIATKFGLGNVRKIFLPISAAIYINRLRKSNTKDSGITTSFKSAEISYRKIEKHQIEKSLDSSLKRLKTDFLDSFLLHEGLFDFLTDESLYYLNTIKKEGKVRHLGLATNFYNLKSDRHLDFWDILQYENRPNDNQPDGFLAEHQLQKHIHHSLLQGIGQAKITRLSVNELAGVILARASVQNPNGITLFSSKKPHHIIENLEYAKKYINKDIEFLNSSIQYAFS
jgi:D-threo-aldose 1-dehydrogenase